MELIKKVINLNTKKLNSFNKIGVVSMTIFLTYLTLVGPFLYVYYDIGYAQSGAIEAGHRVIIISLFLYFFISLFLYKLYKKIINYLLIRFSNKKSEFVERYVTVSLFLSSLFLGICSIVLYLILIKDRMVIAYVSNLERSIRINTLFLPIITIIFFLILIFLNMYFLKKLEKLSLPLSFLITLIPTLFCILIILSLPIIFNFIYFVIAIFTGKGISGLG